MDGWQLQWRSLLFLQWIKTSYTRKLCVMYMCSFISFSFECWLSLHGSRAELLTTLLVTTVTMGATKSTRTENLKHYNDLIICACSTVAKRKNYSVLQTLSCSVCWQQDHFNVLLVAALIRNWNRWGKMYVQLLETGLVGLLIASPESALLSHLLENSTAAALWFRGNFMLWSPI